MTNQQLLYPVVITEVTDDSGHYFTADSPNIPGMHTDGDTLKEVVHNTMDAVATMLDGVSEVPIPQDPRTWILESTQFVTYINIDMSAWQLEKERALKKRSVRRTITVPQYLDDLARARKVNVSRIATEALKNALK